MTRLSLSSMRHKAPAGFGLALFLLGINYCLIGALMPSAAQGMPCMMAASGENATAAAHGGHCAGMADPSSADDEALPAPSAPCCIALTPVLAPEIGKAAPAAMLLVPTAIEEESLVSAPVLSGQLLRAPPDELASSRLLSAPASARAPPLA